MLKSFKYISLSGSNMKRFSAVLLSIFAFISRSRSGFRASDFAFRLAMYSSGDILGASISSKLCVIMFAIAGWAWLPSTVAAAKRGTKDFASCCLCAGCRAEP